MQLDDLYRRVIMDHYKNPRNRGKFEDGFRQRRFEQPDLRRQDYLANEGEGRCRRASEVCRRRLFDQHGFRFDDDRCYQRQTFDEALQMADSSRP